MAGRIVDLGSPALEIRSPVILDSNIVIARWLAAYESPHTKNADRAIMLLR